MAPPYPVPTSSDLPPSPVVQAAPTQSILTRTQRFIEENQRLILLGCAVLAAGGAGYYLYSRSGDKAGPSTPGSAGSGSTAGAKKSKKKSKKKGGASGSDKSGFLKGDGTEGPLVEEIKKPVVEEKKEGPAVVDGTSHLAGESSDRRSRDR
jgi:import receptor subunit TOM70